MEKDLLNKLKPLFVYTKNIGKCIITADMELRNVSSIYKYISKTNDEGNNVPVMPMIGMFKNTVEEVLESYGDEMISQIVKDFSPIPGVDYVPKKDVSIFK